MSSALSELNKKSFPTEFLWSAPEMLQNNCFPGRGTRKGDVYSFAIIMHELECRSLPYNSCQLEDQGQFPSVICKV